MRAWEISIFLMDADGNEMAATCFEKATYVLHESFGKRARQAVKNPPFTIREKGWGEFDMLINLIPIGNPKAGEQSIQHDLNFAQERYESTHTVVWDRSRVTRYEGRDTDGFFSVTDFQKPETRSAQCSQGVWTGRRGEWSSSRRAGAEDTEA